MNRPWRAAYEHCRRIQATRGRSFYRATTLLPPARRPHVWALYAFTRVTDDIVDRYDVETAVRSRELEQWITRCRAGLTAAGPPNPDDLVLRAMWRTMRRLDLPMTLVDEFFASMRLDLHRTSYRTWPQLRRYMRGSAAVIGELMAPVLGAGPAALPYAAALGEAFQLTNFIRDVAEDLRLGRVYLPLDELAANGVTVADLQSCAAAGSVTPAVRAALAEQIARARGLYRAAAPGASMLDLPARPCIRVATALYGQILTEIESGGHNVFAGRVVVPARRRAGCAAHALIRVR